MPLSSLLRSLRLMSGLVLLVFVAMHLANLALGLRSIEAMEETRRIMMAPWRSLAGTVVLASSSLLHGALGLYAIASRRSLAMSRTDWVQLLLGLVTTPLLLNHIVLVEIFKFLDAQFTPYYGLLLCIFWKFVPANALLQVLAIVCVWVHASIGLYSWLVLKPIWRRIGPVLVPLLFAVPILALLGFVQGGKEVMTRLEHDAVWQAQITANFAPILEAKQQMETIRDEIFLVYLALAVIALAIFLYRALRIRSQPVAVAYDGGLIGQGRRGLSILEVSRLNNIPHAHVCSGRGRCGTCVIQVSGDEAALTPIGEEERHTLRRIHASEGQRLACQARLRGGPQDIPLAVVRLMPAYADASASRHPEEWANAPAVSLQVSP
jgi:adenylate cyclase